VHDLGWQAHPELYDTRVRLMYQALFPWAARRADRFIAVSRYTADDLVRRAGGKPAKIDVVYHGLDPLFAAPPARVPSGSEPPYVLAVGGVSPRKNTRRLIEAFARWRERGGHRAAFRLLITGTSLDREYAAAGTALPDNVALLGYVPKADLPGLYAGASAFLYPGIYEGFGLPILEAALHRLPVFCSAIEPLTSLLTQGVTFFPLDAEPTQIALTIAARLGTTEAWQARHQIRRRYAWPAVYANYLAPLLAEFETVVPA